MNISDLEDVLSSLEPLHDRNDLSEEFGDLSAHLDIREYDEAVTRSILSNIYQHPRLLSDCSVDVQQNGSSDYLFRLTPRGIELNEPAFRRLGEETALNGPDYESRISSHIEHDRDERLIDTMVELLYEIEGDTSYTIDFPLILEKSEIGQVIVEDITLEGLGQDDVHLHFWFDIENLRTYLNYMSFLSYGSRFFPPDRAAVFIQFQNSGEEVEGSSILSVYQLDEDITITQSGYEAYRDRMSTTEKNTTFRNGAPIITPALFSNSESLSELFRTATVYSVFAVFSDRVTAQDGLFEFYTKYGPESLRSILDIDGEAGKLTDEQLRTLCTLYLDFADREDRGTFVGFWRRSAVQQSSEFTELPTSADNIREHYRFIEAETVEGNFDDLSDAVRDTHVFMTDITSQVADATAELSNEIQRLVFTLLGAILANVFLILRWGNIDMVVPFSLFVICAILIFYFPLMDRRIDELEEVKSKAEKDYKTYRDLITGFTGEAFDFSKLADRKDDYIEDAEGSLNWARRNVRRIHASLLLTGLVFAALATGLYPPASPQVLFVGVFVVASGYLTLRIVTTPPVHSYYQIGLPIHGHKEEIDPDDILYTNYLPLAVGGISLLFMILNSVTSILPI